MSIGKEMLGLVVCETLAHELAAAISAEGLDDVTVAIFSARCGHAEIGWESLEAATRVFHHHGRRIYLVGSCASPELNDRREEKEDHRLHRTDACARLFLNRAIYERYAQEGACLLLPGELVHWQADRDRWRSLSATRLVLLDTGMAPEGRSHLNELADFAGLPSEVLPVGLDYFRMLLVKMILGWRLDIEKSRSTAALSEAIRRSSDHVMALDLIGNLTRLVTETEAIESTLELFTLLFAPGRLVYVPWLEGTPGRILSYPAPLTDPKPVIQRLAALEEDYAWTQSGTGFLLRIGQPDETVGLLEIEEVAFPEHLKHYLNLALILGRVAGLTIANARAYERSRQAEEQIRHQAYHDTLTGLPNRLLFNELLDRALTRARRTEKSLAVLFIDLDDFKQVNDLLGHSVGDELLKQVAVRLLGSVRTGDTVARMGGDEFLLLLPDSGRPQDATRIAQRILEGLQPPFECAGREIRVSASIGIALYPEDGQDAETLVKNADTALYRAKDAGRSSYRMYGKEVPG